MIRRLDKEQVGRTFGGTSLAELANYAGTMVVPTGIEPVFPTPEFRVFPLQAFTFDLTLQSPYIRSCASFTIFHVLEEIEQRPDNRSVD
jgi:hypothetical protein